MMLFELQLPNPCGGSVYNQHRYVERTLLKTRPDGWQPRDYVWCEMDGTLFIRRSEPTNNLFWSPVSLPIVGRAITMRFQARCRHPSLGDHERRAGQRRNRQSLTDYSDVMHWLTRVAAGIGVNVEDSEFESVTKIIDKTQHTGKRGFPLMLNEFVVVATVDDVGLFEHALAHGIGDSKAFGCGYIHFWQRGG